MKKKVVSIFLILIILTTNVGVTFATHSCFGQIVKSSISLGSSDLSCGMTKMDEKSCEQDNKSKTILQEKNCCENTHTILSVEDDYDNARVVAASSVNIKFVAVFVISLANTYFFFQEKEQTFVAYLPPLLDQDKSVLFQVFRI